MSSHEKDRRRLSKSSIHPTKENRSRKSRQVPSFDAASNATPTADEAVNTQAHNDGFFNTASEDSYPETNSLPVIHHHQMATSSNIVPEDSQWPAPLLGPSTYPPTQPPLPGLAPDPRIYYPAGDDLDYPNQVGSPSSVAVDQGSVENSPQTLADHVEPGSSYQTSDTRARQETGNRNKRRSSRSHPDHHTPKKRVDTRATTTRDFIQDRRGPYFPSQPTSENRNDSLFSDVDVLFNGGRFPRSNSAS